MIYLAFFPKIKSNGKDEPEYLLLASEFSMKESPRSFSKMLWIFQYLKLWLGRRQVTRIVKLDSPINNNFLQGFNGTLKGAMFRMVNLCRSDGIFNL